MQKGSCPRSGIADPLSIPRSMLWRLNRRSGRHCTSTTRLLYGIPDPDLIVRVADHDQVHVDKARENSHEFETTAEAGKLMHRFTEQQLEEAMDDEMMKPPDSYVD